MPQYDVTDLDKKKAGKTAEKSAGQVYEAGVYEHPEAKDANGDPVQIITLYDPLFGNVQSEAVARLGFQRVRDVKKGDVVTLVVSYEKIQNGTSTPQGTVSSEDLKGLQARLAALEDENRSLKAGNDAKKEETPSSDPAPKALAQQNASELKATAEAEGVDVSGADTNKKLVEAIQKSRDEKEGN